MIRPRGVPEVFFSNVKEAKQEVFKRDLEELLAVLTDTANEDQGIELADANKRRRLDMITSAHNSARLRRSY